MAGDDRTASLMADGGLGHPGQRRESTLQFPGAVGAGQPSDAEVQPLAGEF